MTKEELIEIVAQQEKIPQAKARRIVTLITSELIEQVRVTGRFHLAGVGVYGEEGLEPLAVRQGEVQQDHVEGPLGQALDGRREQLDLDHVERLVPAVAEEIAHHPDVVGIVLDQQDFDASLHGTLPLS